MDQIKLRAAMTKLSFMLLLLIPAIPSFGQLQSPSGNYQVSLDKTIELMDAGAKARYDTLPDHIRASANGSMTGRVFSFQSDGLVSVQWKVNTANRTAAGTWQLNSAGDKLQIVINGTQVEYTITWPGNNGLILRNDKDGGLFTNLYLEKID